jgi:hypothetical protein
MPSFFVLLQRSEQGDGIATIVFLFFSCNVAKKATTTTLLSPSSFCFVVT